MLAAKFVNDTLTERRGRIISQGARELYEFESFPKESYRKNDDEIVWYAIKLTERGGSVAATGLVRIAKDERKPPDIETSEMPAHESTYELEERDIYQELRLRGYEYEGCFRGIIKLYEFESFPKESYRKNDDEILWYAIKLTERDLKCDISFLRSSMRTINSADEVELDPKRNHGVANVYNRLDGRTMFAASGYLVFAWKELAKRLGQPIDDVPVMYEDVRIHRATSSRHRGPVKVFVGTSDIMGTSGEFMVVEGGSVAATGLIRIAKDERKPPDIETSEMPAHESTSELEERDIYQELRRRGYEYEGCFRGIIKASLNRE
ncbi:hypothetical protein HPB52_006535 [Rhipicephalus sanguineus]|uniref:Uncharacterized protein n=1 Tax=Rhipicephalus sanguineus TaxID=34632 RepID=A0A9D4SS53_RHISA|nr:hypothetical protein HPB52_006535 [Rhipicephalus sanguineus]